MYASEERRVRTPDTTLIPYNNFASFHQENTMDASVLVTLITTIITTITTVALAILTANYVRLTKAILRTTERSIIEQHRPYVIVQIFAEDLGLYLSIKNIGRRIAKNVKIEFTPGLDFIVEKTSAQEPIFDSLPLLHQSILPPEHDVKNLLVRGPEYFDREDAGTHKFTVHQTYSDENDTVFNETYFINISQFYYAKKVVNFTEKHYLNEISKELKGIKEAISKRS